ncbi:MAG: glycerol-3-phosphate 1-O-acyltransferase PlsY [Bacteroidales bacterium]
MTLPVGIVLYIIFIIFAYLIGSISSSIILGKMIYGVDVRDYGSKNPGANNTQRVLGWKMGLLVLGFDLFKGIAAVSLVFFLPFKQETNSFVATQIVFGLAAILGHIFPVYHNFRGGKGVATMCGVLLAIHPFCVLICAIIFFVVLAVTRYVSVSVITAVTCFPFLVNFMFALWITPEETLTLKIFSIVAGVTIWLTHISNLKRLWHGKEEKFFIKQPVEPPAQKQGPNYL